MQLMHFEKSTDIQYNKTKCMGIWPGSSKGERRNGTHNGTHNTNQTRDQHIGYENINKPGNAK